IRPRSSTRTLPAARTWCLPQFSALRKSDGEEKSGNRLTGPFRRASRARAFEVSSHIIQGRMKTHNSERVGVRLGGCDPSTLADEFGTPLLVVDEVWLRARAKRFRAAFERGGRDASVTYAGKALLLAAVARIVHEEGLYIDVCSLGE